MYIYRSFGQFNSSMTLCELKATFPPYSGADRLNELSRKEKD
jgi:hypothetical protein